MITNRIFKPAKSRGGKYLSIITISIAILFLIIFFATYPLNNNISYSVILISIYTITIAGLILLIYAYYELEYILTSENLLIKWGLKTTKVPINEIERIIKAPTKMYQGIRLGGVGVPGYLFGRFKYLIQDEFETVSLYATKLDTLIFIETIDNGKKKFYGITPAEEEEFLTAINESRGVKELQIKDNEKTFPSFINRARDIKYALSLFILSLIISVSGLIYFLAIYVHLPQTVPLHFDSNFMPNQYGSKVNLLGVIFLFIFFGIGFSSLLYYYIHKRTHLDQTRYGYSIMFLPLAISLMFLIITIIILVETLAFA